jgi:hypothetical protein
MPMIFALKTFMIEAPSGKINPVFSFESGLVMGIVNLVTIMPVPGRIRVVGISRVMSFVEIHIHVDLGIRRIGDKASCYDQ